MQGKIRRKIICAKKKVKKKIFMQKEGPIVTLIYKTFQCLKNNPFYYMARQIRAF